MSWHRVITRRELADRGVVVFKRGRHQLAVLERDGRCFAIANRCPHEGYPLSQGTVDGACVLTCNWHNWKFDLATGRNLLGGDHARVYPLEQRGDELWVDLRDPPAEETRARAMTGLREAFDERDHGWIARQLARLCAAGLAPEDALPAAISWCAPRLEWGMTHAIPAAADWLALAERRAGAGRDRRSCLEDQLICVAEAVDHMAFDALRRPEFPFPAAAAAAPLDEPAFQDAVEREDADRAIALIRGAVAWETREGAARFDYEALARPLARAALRHYLSFGHALIYTVKLGELIARLGPAIADDALAAHVRGVVYAQREDLIPEFRPLAQAVADYPVATGEDPGPIPDAELDAIMGAPLRDALAWVHARATVYRPTALHDALLRACARAMLRFDARHDEASHVKVADNIGWLDFTHSLTFASAVRQRCALDPALWPRGLLQMACFLARNRSYLDPDLAIADARARWRVDDAAALLEQLHARLLDHGQPLPIFPVHVLKTCFAVERELPFASAEARPLLLAALRRYASATVKQKHARRDVHQAMALIGLD
ncbi:MAG: Rieske (2Fe-2S) protein [Myxococcales bacterium]|nr:Rieske (2Fe-2S) protein [Myxococcales bacterium]